MAGTYRRAKRRRSSNGYGTSEAMPFFERLCPAMTKSVIQSDRKTNLSSQRRHQAERIGALDPLPLGRRDAEIGQHRDRDLRRPERKVGAEQQLRWADQLADGV